MAQLHSITIRSMWLLLVCPRPSRMNLEAFRQALLAASHDHVSAPTPQFAEILQVLSKHTAVSDSLPDSAIEEITKMVNSLPTFRRRATDGLAGDKPQVLLIDGYGDGARRLAFGLGQFAVPVAALDLSSVDVGVAEDLGAVSIVIVGNNVLQAPQLVELRALLDDLAQLHPEPPAVVLACDGPLSFEQRLAAAALGAVRIFLPEDEVRSIRDLAVNRRADAALDGAKVLLIDDSPTDAYHAVGILREQGLVVEHVGHPAKAIEAVRRFAPNLIVMDFHMPVANGDVLASVLRQDPEVTMPIIFLSSMDDSEQQLLAISHGADAFVTKPIQQGAFIKAIKSMMARARSIDRRMRRDPLTSLLNHGQILETAKRMVAEGVHGSLAIIDIDHFKTVNDTYGHPVGDRVLIRAAEFLSAGLRESDSIGRVGGEEFAVVLPGTGPETAALVMDRIRGCFANLQHEADVGGAFSCSFSCGVVALDQDVATALRGADEALYQAKHGGRNRVVIYGAHSVQEAGTVPPI
ncbi:TPA: diguanylate cyclase [Pseudomonas aeruginosa]|nr:diguanylate cyclase [Pseudomonas aeruginosa]